MKGSTLHRSALTKENMGVLANLGFDNNRRVSTKSNINHYYKTTKNHELDVLWGGAQKAMQKVHNISKTSNQKSPAAYLTIGFLAGVLFMSCIILIVSIFSINPKVNTPKEQVNEASVALIGDEASGVASEAMASEEKYVVKQGDTLNGIAYRFYGKYDEAKILKIQEINKIVNPASIRVGQELIIPISEAR